MRQVAFRSQSLLKVHAYVHVYPAESLGTLLICALQVPPTTIRASRFILATSLPERMLSQLPVLLLCRNQSIHRSTYVGLVAFLLFLSLIP